ncbi:MAG: glutamine amidotransferase, partial [Anaerovoracaceae bacterium]
RAIDEEKVFLAICGGYQILGNYYKTWDGQQFDYMGCLDIYTEGHQDRMIGNYMFTCDALGGEKIVGFENHSGKTYRGKGSLPIGKVLAGHGNNGEDGTEGVAYKNVFATYSHGPVLPKNPKFCDLLLRKALERKYGEVALEALDDEFENKAHDYMVSRLEK